MSREKSRGTLVDHLVAAIEPALIMIMVGGLMFFLLDLWYDGPFLDRLRWILFWFIFGVVLITRIGMQNGAEQAQVYGAVLGGAVALVATSFAGFQPFLLAVMGLVWWATHKLTYDCTLLDEDQDAGVGLLEESGLDPTAPAPDEHGDPDAMTDALRPPRRPWWKVWERDPEDARRPHAPGVWLIYFSLASLPVFGLGQWLVPAVEEERRGRLPLYVLAYIAAAMGLLLATSFLNLRRYLRKRKLAMPSAMTATWLTTGAVLIVGLTLAAAALPPSLAGVRTITGSIVDAGDRRASRWAVLKDSGVKGEGTPSEDAASSKSDGSQQGQGESEGSGKADDPNASQKTNGQGREGGKAAGRSGSGSKGKSSSKGGSSGEKGQRSDQSDGKAGSAARKSDAQKSKGGQSGSEKKGDSGSKGDGESSSRDGREGGSSRSPSPPSMPFQAPGWLRIPILIVGGAFLIYGAFRYGPGLLRGLWAFLASLFGGLWFGGPRKPKAEEAEAPEPSAPPRPFSSYPNPFDAGLDQRLSPGELVVYSFEALEAWAYERGQGRAASETPGEFVGRLGATFTGLGADADRLNSFFVAIAYGRRGVRAEALPPLRDFWLALEAAGFEHAEAREPVGA
jgi:hypothetical protein